MEQFPQQKQHEQKNEVAEFFDNHPLPEGLEQYADKAWELHLLAIKFYDSDEQYKILSDFAKAVEKRNPNARNCYLFEVLIGSSRRKTAIFDLEGDDSIEKFLMETKI